MALVSEDPRPYRGSLQEYRPCGSCGTIQPKAERVVLAVVPLRVGEMLTSHLIVWCETCWTAFAGPSAEKIEETP